MSMLDQLEAYTESTQHPKVKYLYNNVVSGPSVVKPDGIEQFKSIVGDRVALHDFFFKQTQFSAFGFLEALFRTNDEGRGLVVQALSKPDIVASLIGFGQRANLNGVLEKLTALERDQILMSPGAKRSVDSLSWHGPA